MKLQSYLAVLGLLAGLCAPATAATALLPDPAAAQALSCLQHREKPPRFPPDTGHRDRDRGLMRVQLTFTAPDQPPKIEVLANIASEAMQDEAYAYLASYRLPCMERGQAAVVAVQEFRFDREPSPLHPLEQRLEMSRSCLVMPRQGLEGAVSQLENQVSKVLVEVRFDGDGTAEPKVDIIYSSGSHLLDKAVLGYVTSYRMPCRQAGDRPYAFEQGFIQTLNNAKPSGFKQRDVSLPNFLATLRDLDKQQVNFDFKTMSCPFTLEWTSMAPARPNRLRELGPRNPNRAAFIAWLQAQKLQFSNRVIEQLLGESLRIEVPCAYLKLPATPP